MFNVATGGRETLNHTFEILRRLILPEGAQMDPIYAAPRSGDIQHSQADISLAREILGYRPKIFFEEGLKLTVEWYRADRQAIAAAS